MLKILAPLAIYFTAFWISFIVDDKVFNGFELIFLSSVASLICGVVLYKLKKPSSLCLDRSDSRPLVRRQFPLIYMAVGVILVGFLALHTSAGRSFEVITHVNDKHERFGKAGKVYIIDIVHVEYGTVRLRVPKEMWSELNVDTPILLELQKNLLGLHVVRSFEPLHN
ncbi:hypothetical protein HC752_24155 [Vibrio sp. S9_S30]|uniref:hypothetical protein n=1 Tax=Vibrio sp. S9_S30 TaxID=2720226 RepID=UPI0016814FC4|nr:hypothetical protein [Vibrio sp. S9_S30]MBD1560015.1 hypothetical protein [Vibrio sp. S9_S30]